MRPAIATRSSGRHRSVLAALAIAAAIAACAGAQAGDGRHGTRLTASSEDAAAEVAFTARRDRMVDEQIRARGVTDARVLAAMREVPRHHFVPESERSLAYADRPLPIGWSQTISQPYIVALMCSLLELEPDARVLEVGTGSGYHAAVLSRLAADVYSIEIIEPLAERAAATLTRLGYDNVHVRAGDGYGGWPDAAPFDAIVLTAAPPEIPQPLLDQLAPGGRLVAPVGAGWDQELQVVTRAADGFHRETVAPVRFVPMTGRALDGGCCASATRPEQCPSFESVDLGRVTVAALRGFARQGPPGKPPAPVAGVWVYARDPGTGRTRDSRTGPDGRFEISSLPPGDYEVWTCLEGFDELLFTVDLDPSSGATGVELFVAPSEAGGRREVLPIEAGPGSS